MWDDVEARLAHLRFKVCLINWSDTHRKRIHRNGSKMALLLLLMRWQEALFLINMKTTFLLTFIVAAPGTKAAQERNISFCCPHTPRQPPVQYCQLGYDIARLSTKFSKTFYIIGMLLFCYTPGTFDDWANMEDNFSIASGPISRLWESLQGRLKGDTGFIIWIFIAHEILEFCYTSIGLPLLILRTWWLLGGGPPSSAGCWFSKCVVLNEICSALDREQCPSTQTNKQIIWCYFSPFLHFALVSKSGLLVP